MANKILLILLSAALIATSMPLRLSATTRMASYTNGESGLTLNPPALEGGAQGHASMNTALPELPEVTVEQADLVEARDAAYRVADAYDPSGYFMADLIVELAFDADEAFGFVRDNIGLDPYRGVLRGIEGVLAARAGNSLERSLLLKALLEGMAYDARIAFGVPDAEVKQRLLKNSLTLRGTKTEAGPIAALVGFVPPVMERLAARARRDYQWLLPGAEDRIRQAEPLRVNAPSFSKHYWVQWKRDGEWQSLDTAFPQSLAGESFVEVEGYGYEDESNDLHHLQVEVVAESLVDDELKTDVLLSVRLRADVAARRRIHLTFQPANPGQGGTLAEALGAGTAFRPIITIDGEATRGAIAPPLRTDAGANTTVAEFLAPSNSPELSALYLDVTINSPAADPRLGRRVLMYRVRESDRRNGKFDGTELSGVALIDGLPEPFGSVHQVMVSTGAVNPHESANGIGLGIHYAATHMLDDDVFSNLDVDSLMWPLAMQRQAMLAVNEMIVAPALNDLAGARHFIGTPRVYIVSSGISPDQALTVGMRSSIDLLHDDISVVATDQVTDESLARRRLWYGVVQSAFETTQMEIPYIALGVKPDGVISASTRLDGEALDASDVLAATDAMSVPRGLQEALHKGLLVLVSEQERNNVVTWWTVDSSGLAKAVLRPGLGGVTDFTWWLSYTNARLPTRTTVTQFSPDLSRAQINAEMRRALRDATRQAYNKGGGKAAVRRVSRGPKTPSALRGSARSGNTEDTLLRTFLSAALIPVSSTFALVLVSTATVGFIYMTAYVAYMELRPEP